MKSNEFPDYGKLQPGQWAMPGTTRETYKRGRRVGQGTSIPTRKADSKYCWLPGVPGVFHFSIRALGTRFLQTQNGPLGFLVIKTCVPIFLSPSPSSFLSPSLFLSLWFLDWDGGLSLSVTWDSFDLGAILSPLPLICWACWQETVRLPFQPKF